MGDSSEWIVHSVSQSVAPCFISQFVTGYMLMGMFLERVCLVSHCHPYPLAEDKSQSHGNPYKYETH